jgi:hypothetical protein
MTICWREQGCIYNSNRLTYKKCLQDEYSVDKCRADNCKNIEELAYGIDHHMMILKKKENDIEKQIELLTKELNFVRGEHFRLSGELMKAVEKIDDYINRKTSRHGFVSEYRADIAKKLREEYPSGTRICLISMDDPYSKLKPGDTGTVSHVDDIGTVHVNWVCGSSLGLVYEVDEYEKI